MKNRVMAWWLCLVMVIVGLLPEKAEAFFGNALQAIQAAQAAAVQAIAKAAQDQAAALDVLKPGTIVAIKSQKNGRYLQVDGKALKATGYDKTHPSCQFEIDRQGEWIGFKMDGKYLQSISDWSDGRHTVRFENQNFKDPSHTWEHWRFKGNLSSCHLQNQGNNGHLSVRDGDVVTTHDHRTEEKVVGHKQILFFKIPIKKKFKAPAGPYGWEQLSIEIIKSHEQLILERKLEEAQEEEKDSKAAVPAVWGVNANNQIYLRTGISKEAIAGTGWQQVEGGLQQISVNHRHAVWGVNPGNEIYVRMGVTQDNPTGLTWKKIDGGLNYIAVGGISDRDNVWGVNKAYEIYVRAGITPDNPIGSGWQKVDGGLAQISVNDSGSVWGVNGAQEIYVRAGITPDNPAGSQWQKVEGGLSHVAVGSLDGNDVVWGVNKNSEIYLRTGITPDNPAGSNWQKIDGGLKQIAVGRNGLVWGVNNADEIYIRTGVTPENQAGTGWQKIDGGLKHVSCNVSSSENLIVLLPSLSVPAKNGQYDWNTALKFDEQGEGSFIFDAKAHNDIHVSICRQAATQDPMYEFVVGGWGNTKSVIRRRSQGNQIKEVSRGIASPGNWSTYWVRISKNRKTIALGEGAKVGRNVLIEEQDANFLADVQYFAFSSWNTPIEYRNIRKVTRVQEEQSGNLAQERKGSIPTPQDSPALQKLPQGTVVALKVVGPNDNGTYLQLEAGRYLTSSAKDSKDVSTHFTVLRKGNWIGFKSYRANSNNLQAVPSLHEVRFENKNFAEDGHTWEQWALLPEKPDSLETVWLHNHASGGFLTVPDEDWDGNRIWTRKDELGRAALKDEEGKFAIEIIQQVDDTFKPGKNKFVYAPEVEKEHAVFNDAWKFTLKNKGWAKFKVRALQGLVVALSAKPAFDAENHYALIVGDAGNSCSVVKKNDKVQLTNNNVKLLQGLPGDGTQPEQCWIFWDGEKGNLAFGFGDKVGENAVIGWRDPEPIKDIQFVGFGSNSSRVEFDEITFSPEAPAIPDVVPPAGFEKIAGKLERVSLGRRKGELVAWGIDADGTLQQWQKDQWAAHTAKDQQGKEIGKVEDVAVGADGTLYATTIDGSVYQYIWPDENAARFPIPGQGPKVPEKPVVATPSIDIKAVEKAVAQEQEKRKKRRTGRKQNRVKKLQATIKKVTNQLKSAKGKKKQSLKKRLARLRKKLNRNLGKKGKGLKKKKAAGKKKATKKTAKKNKKSKQKARKQHGKKHKKKGDAKKKGKVTNQLKSAKGKKKQSLKKRLARLRKKLNRNLGKKGKGLKKKKAAGKKKATKKTAKKNKKSKQKARKQHGKKHKKKGDAKKKGKAKKTKKAVKKKKKKRDRKNIKNQGSNNFNSDLKKLEMLIAKARVKTVPKAQQANANLVKKIFKSRPKEKRELMQLEQILEKIKTTSLVDDTFKQEVEVMVKQVRTDIADADKLLAKKEDK